MKKLLAVLSLAVLLPVLVLASTHFRYDNTFSNDQFTAVYPTADSTSQGVQKSQTTGTTTTDQATYTQTAFSESVQNDAAAFFVAYFDYSSVRDTGADTLDKALDGGMEKAGFVLVPDSRKNTALAGLFAREAAGTNDTLDIFMRDAVIGNRLWLTLIVASKDVHATQEDADEFFNSVTRR